MSTETIFQKAEPNPPRKDKWYWWLMSGDDWTAPEINNSEPYLPGWKNQTLRNFMWWCRNPIGNFVGWVVGLSAHDRWITGSVPVIATTPLDEKPPRRGWKWSVTRLKPDGWLGFPFIAYYGICEFYFGWRPYDGALGFKLVNASTGEN